MEYADLELGIHQYKEQFFRVDFRLSLPSNDAEIRAASRKPIEVRFDFDQLRDSLGSPEEYGRRLTGMLFADPALRVALARARALTLGQGKELRLRLFIDFSAPTLHALHWETLRDPETGMPLATDENVIFSRYYASIDEHPVKLKKKGDLRALVAVASPTNAQPINIEEELQRARDGLKSIQRIDFLPENGRKATLENLLDALRAEKGIDILYLVCHGKVIDNQPYIFLEDAQGKADRVNGDELARRMLQIHNRPRLVVLISCESAGTGTGDALAALGPHLADIGVPAVIAMQSYFTMFSAAIFLPTFFRELQRDGQIDRAVAAARAAISDRPDAWVPVLFMRLKSGRLWYKPGINDLSKAKERLDALCQNIDKQKLTPILGPGVVEPLLGSLREIAQRWAVDFNYPMSPHERESLPQVSQFLSITRQAIFPLNDLEDSLKKHLVDAVQAGASGIAGGNAGSQTGSPTINQLMEQRIAEWWQKGSLEPHKVLAGFGLPIYITANQDHLLEAALIREGKRPRTIFCPWNNLVIQPGGAKLDDLIEEEPDSQNPLVFHLFGSWDQPDSVVLTEDDYFRFLMSVAADKNLIPYPIRQSLVDSSLLFLGFQIEEWSFRVIFNSLLSSPGASRRSRYAHIAAQIEPEDARMLEPSRALQYLEQYCNKKEDTQIDIYWGSPEDFIVDLVACQLSHQE